MESHHEPIVELGDCLDIRGRSFRLRTLRVDGADEFEDFMRRLGYPNPQRSGDRRFLEKLAGYLKVIADEGIACSDQYLRRIQSSGGDLWPDQWEIRISQGRANHRFYGFLAEGDTFYIVRHRDKRQAKADRTDLDFVRRVRNVWLGARRT